MMYFEPRPAGKPARPHARSVTMIASGMVEAWAQRNRTPKSPRGPFVLDEAPLSNADIAGSASLLPVFIWHAETLYKFGIKGTGFGAEFAPDAEALLGRSVSLDKVFRSNGEILSFLLEALEDARLLPASTHVPGAVEIRSLVNMFAVAMGAAPVASPQVVNQSATPSPRQA
jgi:hypothetical protein